MGYRSSYSNTHAVVSARLYNKGVNTSKMCCPLVSADRGQPIRIQLSKLERRISRRLSAHLKALGLSSRLSSKSATLLASIVDKEAVRSCYRLFRLGRLAKAKQFIEANYHKLLPYFANGDEIDPLKISPSLEVVQTGTTQASIFRLASLTWSIPVSEGYGRRLRFLVWDDHNGKLIGLLALGDPVFNLLVRDKEIGWSSNERKDRLVCMMDAFVLGAIAPYNMLLCGKLMACLVRTVEVRDEFRRKYHHSHGIISGKAKHPELVVVTTTSALGRSSVYNKLKLAGQEYFRPLGYTSGYGHFHVPDCLFNDIREYLRLQKHPYSEGNRFGEGPNWRLRAIRAGLELMGVDRDILLHGIRREVFICNLAKNALNVLRGEESSPDYCDLLSIRQVAALALDRWVRPRAERNPHYREWKREGLEPLLHPSF